MKLNFLFKIYIFQVEILGSYSTKNEYDCFLGCGVWYGRCFTNVSDVSLPC